MHILSVSRVHPVSLRMCLCLCVSDHAKLGIERKQERQRDKEAETKADRCRQMAQRNKDPPSRPPSFVLSFVQRTPIFDGRLGWDVGVSLQLCLSFVFLATRASSRALPYRRHTLLLYCRHAPFERSVGRKLTWRCWG